jgi:hypothetical protein
MVSASRLAEVKVVDGAFLEIDDGHDGVWGEVSVSHDSHNSVKVGVVSLVSKSGHVGGSILVPVVDDILNHASIGHIKFYENYFI